MSWQSDKAVPLLAGEAFCEKPPLTYWVAGATIRMFGKAAWAARLPNLLYAFITALGVWLLARRAAGPAGRVGRGGGDQHLLAFLPSRHLARHRRPAPGRGIRRLAGRLPGILCRGQRRSAPRLHADARRPGCRLLEQECRRLDGPRTHARHADGVGKTLARAPALGALCGIGASGSHDSRLGLVRVPGRGRARTSQGVLLEQFGGTFRSRRCSWRICNMRPDTATVPASISSSSPPISGRGSSWSRRRCAGRGSSGAHRRTSTRGLRFAVACIVPTLVLLSVAATARNVYFAPAMPGFALLIGWWVAETVRKHDAWDLRAVRVTAALVLAAALGFARRARDRRPAHSSRGLAGVRGSA